MNDPLPVPNHRLLVIDDNAAIHEDFRKILCPGTPDQSTLAEAETALFGAAAPVRQQADFSIDSAYQGKEGLEMVRRAVAEGRPYALAFVDVRMPPGWDGVETIGHLWRDNPDLQVVICTAYSDYSWEQIAQQLGHTDSLVILKKPFDTVEVLQLAHALTKKWFLDQQARFQFANLDRLVHQRTQELQDLNQRLHQEIAQKEQVEQALRLSEERFAKAFRSSPIPLAILRLADDRYVDANESFLLMIGRTREETLGDAPDQLGLFQDSAYRTELLDRLRRGQSVRQQEYKLRDKAGREHQALLSLEWFDLGGQPHALVIVQDMTEHLGLEEQLRQSQKMQAIGQLAAGVAHDFNNILTVIQAHTSLMQLNTRLDQDMTESLQEVSTAAERAATLTRQLLAFSRKQVMRPEGLDLNQVIRHLSAMLRRLIGEHIELRCEFQEHLVSIHGDAGCVEQVLINLAVNARDAMPGGGQLIIRTANTMVNPVQVARNPEARPGPHVCVTVTDTGHGMIPSVMQRIFEPFFTTKDVGKGTGLGLATAYGIMKQHNGWIEVASQVGQGSTFSLFFPPGAVAAEPSAAKPAEPLVARNKERILLVEDEKPLREILGNVLRQYGYRVFPAGDGAEAVRTWQSLGGQVDLLLTDMVMPGGMSGLNLAQTLRGQNPRLKVLYTSGYTSELAGDQLSGQLNTFFLPKPYDINELTSVVRNCLEEDATSSP